MGSFCVLFTQFPPVVPLCIIQYNIEPENAYGYNLQTLFRFHQFYMRNCVCVYIHVCVGV